MSMPTRAHTLKKFDEELATLRDLVLRMGGIVEEQVQRSVELLAGRNLDGARDVVDRDRDIDRLELQADEEIAQLLALRAPLGVDLRTVLTLSKTVNDLERVGDEAKKLAKVALKLERAGSDLRSLPFLPGLLDMAQASGAMLHSALDALVRLDLQRADQLSADDDALDARYDQCLAAIVQHMGEHAGAVPACVELLFAAKSIERIGDHAKNISEYVHYLVEGRDIRHPKVNPNLAD